jgi:hypothetical protein
MGIEPISSRLNTRDLAMELQSGLMVKPIWCKRLRNLILAETENHQRFLGKWVPAEFEVIFYVDTLGYSCIINSPNKEITAPTY